MRPQPSNYDSRNCRTLHLKQWSDLIKRFGFCKNSNRSHVRFIENCATIALSAMRSAASFAMSVGVVFSHCSQKQMRRIATLSIIALMANTKPGGNVRISAKAVRNNVSGEVLVVESNLTIAATPHCSPPFPAIINPRHGNTRPEFGDNFLWNACSNQSFRFHLDWILQKLLQCKHEYV